MKRSTDHILTTHAGSLAKPPGLEQMIADHMAGNALDTQALESACRLAVEEIVRQQAEAGISVVDDGEASKPNFVIYARQRLSGFGTPQVPMPQSAESRDFPSFRPRHLLTPCIEPLGWRDFSPVERDIENLKAAAAKVQVEEVFMPAVSPGCVANFFPNRYYPSREGYLEAVAGVMKREYEAIVNAGIVLQLDCPDLALKNIWFSDTTMEEFRRIVAGNIEALNYAIRDIDPDMVRIHVCWGGGAMPRNHDVPLAGIVDLLLTARVGALSIVGVDGAHEHEWKVWKDVRLPDEMVLIPGVINSATAVIEHPEVVADRIIRYASVVGRDRVIAGTDCGLELGVEDPLIQIAKLRAMAQGAERASEELWG